MKNDIVKNNGATYLNLRHDKAIVGTCCIDNKRIKFVGTPKITITKDSYKFGKEMQISLHSLKGEAEIDTRNPTKYDCLEFIFPLKDGLQFLRECRAILDDIEKTIKESNK